MISLAVIRKHLAEQRVTLGKREDAQGSMVPADALASSLLLFCSQLGFCPRLLHSNEGTLSKSNV